MKTLSLDYSNLREAFFCAAYSSVPRPQLVRATFADRGDAIECRFEAVEPNVRTVIRTERAYRRYFKTEPPRGLFGPRAAEVHIVPTPIAERRSERRKYGRPGAPASEAIQLTDRQIEEWRREP